MGRGEAMRAGEVERRGVGVVADGDQRLGVQDARLDGAHDGAHAGAVVAGEETQAEHLGPRRRAQPTMSASVKNCAISASAFSGLSDPCTELPVKLSA